MSGYRPPSPSWERPAQRVARAFIERLESADMERLCEHASPCKAFHAIASRLKDDEAFGSDVLLVKAHETRAGGQFQSSSDAAAPHGPISAWPHWFRSATGGFDMPLLYLLRSDSVAKLRAAMLETNDRAILFNEAETVKSRWPKGVQPGVPLWLAGSLDSLPYDPASGAEALAILRSALRALYIDERPGYFYFTLHDADADVPPVPRANLAQAHKGMYQLLAPSSSDRPLIRLLGAGQALARVVRAGNILRERWGVESEIWSCPSYTLLAREGHAVERWNTLHPASRKKASHIGTSLGAGRSPVLAVTGYAQYIASQIGGFVPGRFVAIGSDSHPGVPGSPDVDWIVAVALRVLGDENSVPTHWAHEALKRRPTGTS